MKNFEKVEEGARVLRDAEDVKVLQRCGDGDVAFWRWCCAIGVVVLAL